MSEYQLIVVSRQSIINTHFNPLAKVPETKIKYSSITREHTHSIITEPAAYAGGMEDNWPLQLSYPGWAFLLQSELEVLITKDTIQIYLRVITCLFHKGLE